MSRHYLKNRTIVSSAISGIIDDAAEYIGMEPVIHRYPTGAEFGTWDIPPEWNVREAWLKDKNGSVIASYDQNPLFLAPYSTSFRSHITLEELKKHVSVHPALRGAFFYEHRLAYNSALRLKDWRISLPAEILDSLSPDMMFEICIDVDTSPGEMIIAEFILPGSNNESIALLANYCHPGQINDSFSGLAVLMEVFRSLAKCSTRHFSYRLILLPETIGSSVMLAADPKQMSNIKGALFSEMVAWGGDWLIKQTYSGNTYMDIVSEVLSAQEPDLNTIPFSEGAGNDEIVFDWFGIPSVSLQRFPYEEYHSSKDNMDRVDNDSMQRAYDLSLKLLEIIENDRIWHCVHPVPFYMSRFNLYHDAISSPDEFAFFRNLLFNLDGRQSLVHIARKLNKSFNDVLNTVIKMHNHGLVQPGETGLSSASRNYKHRILFSQGASNES
jgi:aminopeptidase-like protein